MSLINVKNVKCNSFSTRKSGIFLFRYLYGPRIAIFYDVKRFFWLGYFERIQSFKSVSRISLVNHFPLPVSTFILNKPPPPPFFYFSILFFFSCFNFFQKLYSFVSLIIFHFTRDFLYLRFLLPIVSFTRDLHCPRFLLPIVSFTRAFFPPLPAISFTHYLFYSLFISFTRFIFTEQYSSASFSAAAAATEISSETGVSTEINASATIPYPGGGCWTIFVS